MFYQGSQTFKTILTFDVLTNQVNIFNDCNLVNIVCVPSDYNSETFCNKTVNSASDTYREFQLLFNHCYDGACIDGEFIQQKRNNSAELERNMTHECAQYQCQ